MPKLSDEIMEDMRKKRSAKSAEGDDAEEAGEEMDDGGEEYAGDKVEAAREVRAVLDDGGSDEEFASALEAFIKICKA